MEDYTIVREIGRGGQAVVYEVEDSQGTKYAQKILNSTDESAKKRFEREIRLVLNISHKNIVPILSFDTSSEMYSYIMPLGDGNLKKYLNETSGESELWIFKEILEGVKAAHDGGTIHRDLNPNNILLFAKDGEKLHVAITDFGLGVLSERDTTTLTATHGMGTYQYCSPEQLKNAKDVDLRTDIYSLGVILSNILTGSPFGTVEPSEIPEKYRHIVKKSCDPDRTKRYQSVDELLEAIESIENGAYDRPEDALQEEVELTKRNSQYFSEGTKNIINIYIQNLSDQSLYKDNLPNTEFMILKTMIDPKLRLKIRAHIPIL
ncbi:serine/threonine-protein kinase [Methanogenium sp. MK-MG]|uniref:serine/threonine-protein kinase n=1 Tax=Methanogenium sp. MK-MG TaxID=2599926 RepID=UPI0013EC28C3|nr:serine/threonine-protein kinase [Methanogenium sp. MK-MG]KAF1078640.1 Serine/threonine-protein kinase PknD [Methanogenium sp. MK-MG]